MLNLFRASYQKIKHALTRTHALLGYKLRTLFGQPWREETFEQLEKIFYEADLGTDCAVDMAAHVRNFLFTNPNATSEEVFSTLRTYATSLLLATPSTSGTLPATDDPWIILVVGVNGSGKTTTIAKLARHFHSAGKSVLIAAADTFRAAAIDQLATWAERVSADLVKGQIGGDPAAVVFDALHAAKARGSDIVLIDTAGRLHNKTELMSELAKIRRIATKTVPGAPHETWLVLDATTGQNGVDQAITFHACTPLTGLIMTKLDGSAKGGVLLALQKRLGIPVRWIGVGEESDDLLPFDPHHYINVLFMS